MKLTKVRYLGVVLLGVVLVGVAGAFIYKNTFIASFLEPSAAETPPDVTGSVAEEEFAEIQNSKTIIATNGAELREELLNFAVTAPVGWELSSTIERDPSTHALDKYYMTAKRTNSAYGDTVGSSFYGEYFGSNEIVKKSSFKVDCEVHTGVVCHEKTNSNGVIYYETDPHEVREGLEIVLHYIPLKTDDAEWRVLTINASSLNESSSSPDAAIRRQIVDSFRYLK